MNMMKRLVIAVVSFAALTAGAAHRFSAVTNETTGATVTSELVPDGSPVATLNMVDNALTNRPTKADMDKGWWSEWVCVPSLAEHHFQLKYANDEQFVGWFVSELGDSEDDFVMASGYKGSLDSTELSFSQSDWVTLNGASFAFTATRHRVAAPVPTRPEDIGAASTGALGLKYEKPDDGIPFEDLSQGVRASLSNADTAYDSMSSYVTTASYDRVNHKVLLQNGTNTVAEIPASDFIIDGIVKSVDVSNRVDYAVSGGVTNSVTTNRIITVTFSTVDKGDVSIGIPISEILDPGSYYDKETADARFAKAETYDIATNAITRQAAESGFTEWTYSGLPDDAVIVRPLGFDTRWGFGFNHAGFYWSNDDGPEYSGTPYDTNVSLLCTVLGGTGGDLPDPIRVTATRLRIPTVADLSEKASNSDVTLLPVYDGNGYVLGDFSFYGPYIGKITSPPVPVDDVGDVWSIGIQGFPVEGTRAGNGITFFQGGLMSEPLTATGTPNNVIGYRMRRQPEARLASFDSALTRKEIEDGYTWWVLDSHPDGLSKYSMAWSSASNMWEFSYTLNGVDGVQFLTGSQDSTDVGFNFDANYGYLNTIRRRSLVSTVDLQWKLDRRGWTYEHVDVPDGGPPYRVADMNLYYGGNGYWYLDTAQAVVVTAPGGPDASTLLFSFGGSYKIRFVRKTHEQSYITMTSQLQNDGSDGVHPYISQDEVKHQQLTPVYSQTPTYGDYWTILRDGVDVTAQVSQPTYNALGSTWDVSESCVSEDTSGQGEVTAPADAASLSWGAGGATGEHTYTATRTRTDILGYTLGSQSTKLQPMVQISRTIAQSNAQVGVTFECASTNGIGVKCREDQNCAIEIGRNAKAAVRQSAIDGATANTSVRSVSVAIGADADATVSDSSTKSQAIAIGWHAQAKGSSSIAIGCGARHTFETELSGQSTYSSGSESVAIGYGAKSTANKAIQLGNGRNNATGSLQFREWQLLNASGQIPPERLTSAMQALSGGVLAGIDRAIRPGNMVAVAGEESVVEPVLNGLSEITQAPASNGLWRAGSEVYVDPPLGVRNYDILIREIHQAVTVTNGVVSPVPESDNFNLSFEELVGRYDVKFAVSPSVGYASGSTVILTNAPCILKVREPSTNSVLAVVKPWSLLEDL